MPFSSLLGQGTRSHVNPKAEYPFQIPVAGLWFLGCWPPGLSSCQELAEC